MKAIEEQKLHELAVLFMDQFSIGSDLSLDEFLHEHGEELTDDERNLGYHILSLFNI
jgi:hypothetical protein